MAKKINTVQKKTGGKDPQWELLAGKLRGIIPKLDTEGLAFLVEQAAIHLHNMQVDEHNRAVIAAAAKTPAGKSQSTKSPGVKSTAGKSQGAVKGKPKGGRDGYSLEGTESGSSFYLFCPSDELMFSRNEMAQLVKITGAKGTDLEIRERLYNWFERERRDAFAVIPIADKLDNRLKIIAALIKKNFKVSG